MESTNAAVSTPEASTSAQPATSSAPRSWSRKAVPHKSILKRPPPPSKSFFNLGGLTRDIFPGTFSKFIQGSSAPSHNGNVPSSAPPSQTTFKLPSASNALLPSAVPYDDITSHGSIRGTPLKRAHFILPHLSTVYSFSSSAAPSSAELTVARLEIEDKTKAQREKEKEEGAGAWSLGRIEEFYRECCHLRDEAPLGGVIGALRQANLIAPRTLDLTSVKLTFDAATVLADVFSIEWGLRKLILRDCDLDETSLKLLLHALLIPNSLPYLSLSSNKRLKSAACRFIGTYVSKANTLEFLDLSQTSLDKKSVEYIVSALDPAPVTQPSNTTCKDGRAASPKDAVVKSPQVDGFPDPPGSLLFSPLSPNMSSVGHLGLSKAEVSIKDPNLPPEKVTLLSVRLDECGIRGGSLDVLANAIRTSSVQNLSLRLNKFGPAGAVSIATMLKDYPDSLPAPGSSSPTTPPSASPIPRSFSIPTESPTPSPRSSLLLPSPEHISITSSPQPNTPTLSQPYARLSINRLFGNVSNPPPQSSPPLQTTYTPYIPRSKRNLAVTQPQTHTGTLNSPRSSPNPLTMSTTRPSINTSTPLMRNEVPSFSSSRSGGVTTRHASTSHSSLVNGDVAPSTTVSRISTGGTINAPKHVLLDGHSLALLDKVRSLDNLPRLGALTTLDLRGNDLKAGVTYIAQRLKRNRTLKALNLSDNKIEMSGFVAIAEALKYNTTLEILDMSRNPCCGPGLEGVTTIRTAFTINTALKRLFLSDTGLTSDGAIALAEFLPDARSLLHLDLTHNSLDLAGVMALSAGLKVNRVIRCLDVNVPPNDPEMARLSREILRCCVRNTELADRRSKCGAEIPIDNQGKGSSSLSMSEDLDMLLGNTARGGVWGLIERSELARGVKQDVERERVGKEKEARGQLDGKHKLEIWTKTPDEIVKAARDLLLESHTSNNIDAEKVESEGLIEKGNALVSVLQEMVQVEKDPTRMEELLDLNDRLTSLIKDLKTGIAPYSSERPSVMRRNSKGKEPAFEHSDVIPNASFAIVDSDDENNDDNKPLQSDSQAGDHMAEVPEAQAPSPTVLSKVWVEEEGEIFRKGNVLLGPDELGEEGVDISSEELKRELLEAQVERPRRSDDIDALSPDGSS
ncbi:uncharacterized protein EI90DRAFT_3074459 [Cantharellus anzutake]|uniref:uncharacterized protein n=1 Tax=Cantharellus anzutake TaxID=1750568 RepID=UPI001908CFB3|nr:uncharacterized protein EI90DRAFT_3074459 [Cantharellus anzutake]KAF8324920.1 hypothetical protein EI90DRAFT_3074459 [Cantharellus anzutake]